MLTTDETHELTELNALITAALSPGASTEAEAALRGKLEELIRTTASAAGARATTENAIEYIKRLLFDTGAVNAVPEPFRDDAALTQLGEALISLRQLAVALSRGDLSEEVIAKGYLAGALKSLQANLRHLTWQTQQIAAGDYSQHVDFMGEFASAFNTMTLRLRETVGALHDKQNELRKVIAALDKEIVEHKEALARVRQLQGLLPICSYCKKIRDDQNYWQQVEGYISHHSEAQFSHGICPDCYKKVAKEWGVPERPKE